MGARGYNRAGEARELVEDFIEEDMTTLSAVLFDMDDTLIDWSGLTEDWNQVRRRHLKPVVDKLLEQGHTLLELEQFVEVYAASSDEAWSVAAEPDWIAPQQLNVLSDALRRLGIEMDEQEVRELQQVYAWGALPGVEPFPDAVDVLKTLREAGIRTGLVTNTSATMWMRDRELEAYGLLEYLDVRITAGDIGHLKPHRRAFEHVLEELGIEPESAVFVGDRLHDDVGGAQSIGMKGVWVKRPRSIQHVNGVKPDATIEQLSELLGWLDRWFPGWREN